MHTSTLSGTNTHAHTHTSVVLLSTSTMIRERASVLRCTYFVCLVGSQFQVWNSSFWAKIVFTERKARKEIRLQVNAERAKYMVTFRHQNVGQNGNIQLGNKSFEIVEQFKYLGTTLNESRFHS